MAFILTVDSIIDHKNVVGIYPSLAIADAAIVGKTGFSVIDTGSVSVPDELERGWYWDTVNSAFIAEIPFTDLDNRKAAARACHAQLLNWATALVTEGVGHPAASINLGHDFLNQALRGLYIVMTRAAYTSAQKITFCENTSRGAADITNPAEFYDKIESIGAAPTSPVVWVDVRTGARVNLSAAITTTAELSIVNTDAPNTVGYSRTNWIDSLT